MFKENKRLAATDTLIGQGTIAEGKLISEASLRIEGEYRGDIECKGDVIIGECGIARSNITARDVTLAGKMFGDVFTKGRLIITSSGHLTGNITTNSLIIQDGGRINGSCHMEQAAESKNRTLVEPDNPNTEGKSDAKNDARNAARANSRQAG